MTRHDPHSYADLAQGKISHIDFRIKADFEALVLNIEADYQLAEPVSGSFFLDTFKIDLKTAQANGEALDWEFDEQNDLLGQRLHLKGLDNASSFTLTFATAPEARALQWLPAVQTAGGEHPFLFSQCQAIHARSVFPCQDTPSVRFTFGAEMEVPAALTAVMAAEQIGVRRTRRNACLHIQDAAADPVLFVCAGSWQSGLPGNRAAHRSVCRARDGRSRRLGVR